MMYTCRHGGSLMRIRSPRVRDVGRTRLLRRRQYGAALRGGVHELDGQRRSDAVPDMVEDALPARAVDARIVELALGRPPLRKMPTSARIKILALQAGTAQPGARLEGAAPARIGLHVLQRVREHVRIGGGAAAAGDPQHIERLQRAVRHERYRIDGPET